MHFFEQTPALVKVLSISAAKADAANRLAPQIIVPSKIFLIFILVSVAVRLFTGHPYPVTARIKC